MNKVFILLLFSIFSCGTKPSDTRNELTNDSLPVETSVAELSSETNEAFNKFFEKFRNDSLFQIDRVAFPVATWIWETGEEKPEQKTINKEDWRFLDFHYDQSFANREVDAYTQEVKVYGDTVKLEIRGVDNGIYTDFEFTRQKGKWYLVTEKDYSN
jgi:hypothetical protein